VAERAGKTAAGERSSVAAGAGSSSATGKRSGSGAGERAGSATAWYVLGLSIQVLLWFLVFVAIAAAIGVSGHLTEFRYVRF
jgi:hypothetical protein